MDQEDVERALPQRAGGQHGSRSFGPGARRAGGLGGQRYVLAPPLGWPLPRDIMCYRPALPLLADGGRESGREPML